MEKITISPIGIIHSPYKQTKDIPIQGKFKPEVKAYVELKDEYVPGLKDLDGFSHAIIIYCFHKSDREEVVGKPFLENVEHEKKTNHLKLIVQLPPHKDHPLQLQHDP